MATSSEHTAPDRPRHHLTNSRVARFGPTTPTAQGGSPMLRSIRHEPHIRIDFWLGSQPKVEGREPVFEAKLRIEARSFSVWSFVEPYEVPIPSGEYDVSITRLNRGSYSKRALTHAERFDRDDMERYEVLVRRRTTD
jgi:hypothetical protein